MKTKMYYVEFNGMSVYQGNSQVKAYSMLEQNGKGTTVYSYNPKHKKLEIEVKLN